MTVPSRRPNHPALWRVPESRERSHAQCSFGKLDRAWQEQGRGSARSRSGCCDGAIRWILDPGYHRNARKQSERGVPPNVIMSALTTRQRTAAFRDQNRILAPITILAICHRSSSELFNTSIKHERSEGGISANSPPRRFQANDPIGACCVSPLQSLLMGRCGRSCVFR
jgi:hypothetical protein